MSTPCTRPTLMAPTTRSSSGRPLIPLALSTVCLWIFGYLLPIEQYFSVRNGDEQKCLGYIMVMMGFSVFLLFIS